MKQGVIGFILVIALFSPIFFNNNVSTTIAEELPNSIIATSEGEASIPAQPINNPDIIVMEKVEEDSRYILPYPGILPDHALYPLKLFRDKLLNLFIRDPQRKLEFNLLMSDKKLNMGVFLIEKGKYELAYKTIKNGQKNLTNGIDLMNELLKENKGLVSKNTVNTYIKSSEKHLSVLIIMKKSVPENLQENYSTLTKEARNLKQRLDNLDI